MSVDLRERPVTPLAGRVVTDGDSSGFGALIRKVPSRDRCAAPRLRRCAGSGSVVARLADAPTHAGPRGPLSSRSALAAAVRANSTQVRHGDPADPGGSRAFPRSERYSSLPATSGAPEKVEMPGVGPPAFQCCTW